VPQLPHSQKIFPIALNAVSNDGAVALPWHAVRIVDEAQVVEVT
jgi:hypothetical protein